MQRYSGWLVLALSLGVACSSDDDASVPRQSGDADGGDEEDCPPGTEEFVTGPSGLEKEDAASGIKVRIDWADAQPPANDYNTWKVAVTDLEGMPLPDAHFTFACAWMPKHGHGTNPKTITRLPDGLFEIGKQNLAMNGAWDINLWIEASGSGKTYPGGSEQRNPNACNSPDSAQPNITFNVCVPRDGGGN